MARSKSSSRWLNEHFSDPYVLQAKKDGYRSRACYKLIEINEREKLFRPGQLVVDLGSAPGSWSQVAAESVGDAGQVIASDILIMDSHAGVEFVQGDFTETEVFEKILSLINSRDVDVVISDMAPNMSGVKAVDQPKAMYLAELALDMATQVLKDGGTFVTKLFMGEDFDLYVKQVKSKFRVVKTRKPASSRARSSEVYMVASGYLSS